jgi:hypothetical protein
MRTNRGWHTTSAVFAALSIYVCLISSCRRDDSRKATLQATRPGLGHADSQRTDAELSPGSAANILIDPRFEVAGKRLVLAFCFEDGSAYDPQIYRIRMARVDGGREKLEVAATGDSWLWKEWTVGSLPRGFRFVERSDAAPGVYEVYVDAVVGDGVRRISIGDDGAVRVLPWDQFDSKPPKHCPRVDREKPNILPHGRPAESGHQRPVSP